MEFPFLYGKDKLNHEIESDLKHFSQFTNEGIPFHKLAKFMQLRVNHFAFLSTNKANFQKLISIKKDSMRIESEISLRTLDKDSDFVTVYKLIHCLFKMHDLKYECEFAVKGYQNIDQSSKEERGKWYNEYQELCNVILYDIFFEFPDPVNPYSFEDRFIPILKTENYDIKVSKKYFKPQIELLIIFQELFDEFFDDPYYESEEEKKEALLKQEEELIRNEVEKIELLLEDKKYEEDVKPKQLTKAEKKKKIDWAYSVFLDKHKAYFSRFIEGDFTLLHNCPAIESALGLKLLNTADELKKAYRNWLKIVYDATHPIDLAFYSINWLPIQKDGFDFFIDLNASSCLLLFEISYFDLDEKSTWYKNKIIDGFFPFLEKIKYPEFDAEAFLKKAKMRAKYVRLRLAEKPNDSHFSDL
jgi:hypothetical protein